MGSNGLKRVFGKYIVRTVSAALVLLMVANDISYALSPGSRFTEESGPGGKELFQGAVFRVVYETIGKYLHMGISAETIIGDIKEEIGMVEEAFRRGSGPAVSRGTADFDPLLYGFNIDELEYAPLENAFRLPIYSDGRKTHTYKFYITKTGDKDPDYTIEIPDSPPLYANIELEPGAPAGIRFPRRAAGGDDASAQHGHLHFDGGRPESGTLPGAEVKGPASAKAMAGRQGAMPVIKMDGPGTSLGTKILACAILVGAVFVIEPLMVYGMSSLIPKIALAEILPLGFAKGALEFGTVKTLTAFIVFRFLGELLAQTAVKWMKEGIKGINLKRDIDWSKVRVVCYFAGGFLSWFLPSVWAVFKDSSMDPRLYGFADLIVAGPITLPVLFGAHLFMKWAYTREKMDPAKSLKETFYRIGFTFVFAIAYWCTILGIVFSTDRPLDEQAYIISYFTPFYAIAQSFAANLTDVGKGIKIRKLAIPMIAAAVLYNLRYFFFHLSNTNLMVGFALWAIPITLGFRLMRPEGPVWKTAPEDERVYRKISDHLAKDPGEITIVVPEAASASALAGIDRIIAKYGDKVKPILIGSAAEIEKVMLSHNLDNLIGSRVKEIIDKKEKSEIYEETVKIVGEGRARIILKGKSSSDVLMKMVLTSGKKRLRVPGSGITHMRLFEMPDGGPLLMTDGGINVISDIDDQAKRVEKKLAGIDNSVRVMRHFGVARPVVTVLAEGKKGERWISEDAERIISELKRRGDDPGFDIDGPVSLEEVYKQGNLTGRILVFPWIGPANIIYKATAGFKREMRHVKDVTVRGAFRNYGKLGIFEYQQDGMKRYLSVAVPAPGADVRTKKIFIQKANRILLRKYGIGKPKVAMLDFTEQSRQFRKVPTIRAGIALRRYFSKNAKSCIVEGPMAYDLGDSKEAAKAKGYDSIVAGDADMYLAPDYNTGSMLEALYKYSGKLKLGWDASDLSYGGLATDNGEPVFVVVPSRSDSEFHKERSLDVAAELMSRDREEGVNIRQKKRGATGKTLPGGSIAEALKVVNKSLVEPDILGDVFTRKEFASNRFNGKLNKNYSPSTVAGELEALFEVGILGRYKESGAYWYYVEDWYKEVVPKLRKQIVEMMELKIGEGLVIANPSSKNSGRHEEDIFNLKTEISAMMSGCYFPVDVKEVIAREGIFQQLIDMECTEFKTMRECENYYKKMAARENVSGHVATYRGKVVGVVLYSRHPSEGYIKVFRLSVRQEWLDKGVDRFLVDAVKRDIQEEKCPAECRVEVSRYDLLLRHFYRALGFTEMSGLPEGLGKPERPAGQTILMKYSPHEAGEEKGPKGEKWDPKRHSTETAFQAIAEKYRERSMEERVDPALDAALIGSDYAYAVKINGHYLKFEDMFGPQDTDDAKVRGAMKIEYPDERGNGEFEDRVKNYGNYSSPEYINRVVIMDGEVIGFLSCFLNMSTMEIEIRKFHFKKELKPLGIRDLVLNDIKILLSTAAYSRFDRCMMMFDEDLERVPVGLLARHGFNPTDPHNEKFVLKGEDISGKNGPPGRAIIKTVLRAGKPPLFIYGKRPKSGAEPLSAVKEEWKNQDSGLYFFSERPDLAEGALHFIKTFLVYFKQATVRSDDMYQGIEEYVSVEESSWVQKSKNIKTGELPIYTREIMEPGSNNSRVAVVALRTEKDIKYNLLFRDESTGTLRYHGNRQILIRVSGDKGEITAVFIPLELSNPSAMNISDKREFLKLEFGNNAGGRLEFEPEYPGAAIERLFGKVSPAGRRRPGLILKMTVVELPRSRFFGRSGIREPQEALKIINDSERLLNEKFTAFDLFRGSRSKKRSSIRSVDDALIDLEALRELGILVSSGENKFEVKDAYRDMDKKGKRDIEKMLAGLSIEEEGRKDVVFREIRLKIDKALNKKEDGVAGAGTGNDIGTLWALKTELRNMDRSSSEYLIQAADLMFLSSNERDTNRFKLLGEKRKQIRELMEQPGVSGMAAVYNGKVAGYLVSRKDEATREIEIMDIRVHPLFFERGVEERLVKALMEQLGSGREDCKKIYYDLIATTDERERFFERLGFSKEFPLEDGSPTTPWVIRLSTVYGKQGSAGNGSIDKAVRALLAGGELTDRDRCFTVTDFACKMSEYAGKTVKPEGVGQYAMSDACNKIYALIRLGILEENGRGESGKLYRVTQDFMRIMPWERERVAGILERAVANGILHADPSDSELDDIAVLINRVIRLESVGRIDKEKVSRDDNEYGDGAADDEDMNNGDPDPSYLDELVNKLSEIFSLAGKLRVLAREEVRDDDGKMGLVNGLFDVLDICLEKTFKAGEAIGNWKEIGEWEKKGSSGGEVGEIGKLIGHHVFASDTEGDVYYQVLSGINSRLDNILKAKKGFSREFILKIGRISAEWRDAIVNIKFTAYKEKLLAESPDRETYKYSDKLMNEFLAEARIKFRIGHGYLWLRSRWEEVDDLALRTRTLTAGIRLLRKICREAMPKNGNAHYLRKEIISALRHNIFITRTEEDISRLDEAVRKLISDEKKQKKRRELEKQWREVRKVLELRVSYFLTRPLSERPWGKLPGGALHKAVACIGGNDKAFGQREKPFTLKEFREMRKYSYSTVRTEVLSLIKLGILEESGKMGKARLYRVTERFEKAPPEVRFKIFEALQLALAEKRMHASPTEDELGIVKYDIDGLLRPYEPVKELAKPMAGPKRPTVSQGLSNVLPLDREHVDIGSFDPATENRQQTTDNRQPTVTPGFMRDIMDSIFNDTRDFTPILSKSEYLKKVAEILGDLMGLQKTIVLSIYEESRRSQASARRLTQAKQLAEMSAKKTAKALDVVKTWREKSYFAVQLDSDDENSEIGLSIGRRIFGLGEGEDEYYALLSWTRNELNNLLAEDDLFGGMFIRDTERSVMKLHELMTDLRFAVYREYFLEYSIAGNMFRGDKGMMERFELDIKGNFRERYDVWLDSKWERINDLARFAGDILDAADKISEIRRYDFPKAKGFELEELKMELISALNFNRRICRDQLDLDHLDEQVLTLMISGEEMKGWDHYRMIWSGAMGKIKKRFKGMSRKDLAREDGNVVEGGLSAPLVFTGDLVGLGPEGTGSVLVFFRDMHFVPGREDEHSDTTQPVAVAPDFRIMNIVPGRGETSGGIGLFWDRTVPGEQNLTVTAETEGKHAGSFTSNVKLWKNMDKEDASFVALSTEWIKGYERGGAQHDGGLNRVISFVRNHCAYNGIKFIEGSDAFVAGEVKALKGRDKAASGVVLAGDECIALIEEAFVGELNLRKDERKKVLLGVIDNSQLEEESYVPLMPQLTLMIRLLRYQMKYPDYLEERKDRLREKFDKDGILGLDYDPERGVVKFKPAKVDVESLRPIYSAQVAA